MNVALTRLNSLPLLLGIVATLGACNATTDEDVDDSLAPGTTDDTTDDTTAGPTMVTVDGAPVDVPQLVGFLVTTQSPDGRFASIEAGTDLTCEAINGYQVAVQAAFDALDAADTPDWDEWDRAMGAASVEYFGDGAWSAELSLGEMSGDPPLGALDGALGISQVDADRVGDPLGATSEFFAADYPATANIISVTTDGAEFTASGTGEWENQTTGESSGTVSVTMSGGVTRCDVDLMNR